jgi:pseudouridine kinase
MSQTVICIGASLVDESFLCIDQPQLHTSNPATYKKSAGGVARNVAHHLAMLGNKVELITHFGNDDSGHWLKNICSNAGIGLSHAVFNDEPTGRYSAILSPDGNLYAGAAVAGVEEAVTVSLLKDKSDLLRSAFLIMIDCNLSKECLEYLISFCKEEKIYCIVEPVSVQKATRLRNLNLENVLMITPNKDELISILNMSSSTENDSMIRQLKLSGIQNIWMRNGIEGSTIYSGKGNYLFTPKPVNVIDVTGAGDAALSGWIHAFLHGKNINECLTYGHALAELILSVNGAVLETLNAELLDSAAGELLKNNLA